MKKRWLPYTWGRLPVVAATAAPPEPQSRTVTLCYEDEPMQRARHVFMAMGMGIRSDEVGELMLRRAADIIAVYRDIDRSPIPLPAKDQPAQFTGVTG